VRILWGTLIISDFLRFFPHSSLFHLNLLHPRPIPAAAPPPRTSPPVCPSCTPRPTLFTFPLVCPRCSAPPHLVYLLHLQSVPAAPPVPPCLFTSPPVRPRCTPPLQLKSYLLTSPPPPSPPVPPCLHTSPPARPSCISPPPYPSHLVYILHLQPRSPE